VSEPMQWNLNGHKVNIEFGNVDVLGEQDLARLLSSLAVPIAKAMSQAKEERRKDWAVSGSVSTTSGGTTATATATVSGKDDSARDWNASISASTSVGGGMTGTATVSTGTSGTSGIVSIGGTFP